jgi:hypothetical protein
MTFWHGLGKYTYNILISIDQRWNTIFGGDPDETISSRLGKIKTMHGGTIPWSRPISKIVDVGLETLHPGHSIKAIEKDEGKDAVLDTDCEKPYTKGGKV